MFIEINHAAAAKIGFFYDWQYNGAAPIYEILAWCEENIKDSYTYNRFETIFFNNREAYVYFILRWS